jgi:hypothetical protein
MGIGLRAGFWRAARVCKGRYLPGLLGAVGELVWAHRWGSGGGGRGLNFRIRLNKMPARPKLPAISPFWPVVGGLAVKKSSRYQKSTRGCLRR